MTLYRCSFDEDAYDSVMEAALYSTDLRTVRDLVRLAISMKWAVDNGWVWRGEDETQ